MLRGLARQFVSWCLIPCRDSMWCFTYVISALLGIDLICLLRRIYYTSVLTDRLSLIIYQITEYGDGSFSDLNFRNDKIFRRITVFRIGIIHRCFSVCWIIYIRNGIVINGDTISQRNGLTLNHLADIPTECFSSSIIGNRSAFRRNRIIRSAEAAACNVQVEFRTHRVDDKSILCRINKLFN